MKKFVFLCIFLLFTACNSGGGKLNGYVEGEYVRVASTSAGLLGKLFVERGAEVKAGDPLFALDTTQLENDRKAAAAELEQANARWSDLTKGKRPEEIDVILKQKAQAEAELKNAEQQWKRSEALVEKKFATRAQLDADKAAMDVARGKVAEMDAQLKTADLGGRVDEISAAAAAKDMAAENVKKTEKQLAEAAPNASDDARVEDTYFRPGEYVSAGVPVVSLLPPQNVKIRFFVPERMLSQVQQGQSISVGCDGCKEKIAARINFIATQAEYTPPVIYSVGSRDKLVFMVEARPDNADAQLKPGQPVDITLEGR